MREVVLTDLHGEYDKAMALLESVNYDMEKDKLILMGDYFDRGPQNKEMALWLSEVYRHPNVVLLLGNHDLAMLDLLEYDMHGENMMSQYLNLENMVKYNGMDKTLEQLVSKDEYKYKFMSYVEVRDKVNKAFPELLNALKSAKWFYEGEHGYYTHAALPEPHRLHTTSDREWKDWVWAQSDLYAKSGLAMEYDKPVHVGHYSLQHLDFYNVEFDKPYRVGNVVFCDGGLATGADGIVLVNE